MSQGNSNSNSDSSMYTSDKSSAYNDYKAAEFLAQADHGMQYIGGVGGYWTHPTSDPKGAAELMQVSADLRAQHAFDRSSKGFTDAGHFNSWYAAQDAADNIPRFISSNNITNTNSYTSYGSSYSNNNNIPGYYPQYIPPAPGTTWTSNGVTHTQTIYGSSQKTAKCWRCGSTYDYGLSSIHCI
jgi:hypothetical protein